MIVQFPSSHVEKHMFGIFCCDFEIFPRKKNIAPNMWATKNTWPDTFHQILVVANRDPYVMVYEMITT